MAAGSAIWNGDGIRTLRTTPISSTTHFFSDPATVQSQSLRTATSRGCSAGDSGSTGFASPGSPQKASWTRGIAMSSSGTFADGLHLTYLSALGWDHDPG